MRELVGRKISE